MNFRTRRTDLSVRAPKPGPATTINDEGQLLALAAHRIAFEGIGPEIDGGRFPAKVALDEDFVVEADIFGDGHDIINAVLVWRAEAAEVWTEEPMDFLENDRWVARVRFPECGAYLFSFLAWRDLFATWRKDTAKKVAVGQSVSLEIVEGIQLVEKAIASDDTPSQEAASQLKNVHKRLTRTVDHQEQLAILMEEETFSLMSRGGVRTNLSRYQRSLKVHVDSPLGAFSAWYEIMPRSQGPAHRHGTFDDVIERLPYVSDLGFDILYFTPIHPIGRINRKGPNNSLVAGPDDPGSPYAIGSDEGGHNTIHPELGNFEDFARLVAAAKEHGLEIALDFAIQCAPDHPWIKEHPEWFDWRPDGTIKFAENPPKRYEDIVNVHFYREALPSIWYALRDIVLFWIDKGVKVFRVDNPHTKPFPFWEWMIAEVRSQHPDTIFLSEAFTRPKVMKRLAKVGFNQSYTYFTWRNEKQELIEYLTELTQEECRHYMRPNFFPSTPDINPYFLQASGRPGFRIRLVLAATLANSYGIYNGFEICDAAAVPGKEEYLNSEKYQLRQWDMDAPGNIQDDIRLINGLRRTRPALKAFTSLKFHNAWNDKVLYYAKSDPAHDDYLLFHVLLDPHHAQEFEFEVPFWEFGLPDDASIEVQDVVNGNHFTWHGKTHTLTLEPHDRPYAIWRLIPPGAPR